MVLNKQAKSLYDLKKSNYLTNKNFFEKFLERLGKPFDDYLEINIKNSEFYTINYLDNHIGFFSILEEKYLTSFYIPDSLLSHGQEIFKLILSQFNVELMLVTSFDETGLCLVMDYVSRIKTHYIYFKLNSLPVRKAEYPINNFRKAEIVDIPSIKKYTQNFIDGHEERILKNQLFILEDDNKSFLGLAVMIPHSIQKGICSFGIYVREESRNISVGRSMLLHITKEAEKMNLTPRCACPMSNDIYRKTLESGGFVSESRLFIAYLKQ